MIEVYVWNNTGGTVSPSYANGGSTASGNTLVYESAVDCTATPSSGYVFSYWSPNGTTEIAEGDSIGSYGSEVIYAVFVKEPQVLVTKSKLTAIADAIRTKAGTSDAMTLDEMPTNVENIPSGGGGYVSEITLTQCNDYQCAGQNRLTKVTIADGVTSIGSYAFQHCYGLTSITIPDSVTSIGALAFRSCNTLHSISIPQGVTKLGSSAFQYCYALSSIALPDAVKTIENGAFADCPSVPSVTIPSSVTYIGSLGLYNCMALRVIKMEGSTPPTLSSTNSLSPISTSQTSGYLHYIIVPDDAVDAYKSASNWSSFASIIYGESDDAVQDWENQVVVSDVACGTNLTCSLTLGGVLTISGTGTSLTQPSLGNYKYLVKSCDIPSGITCIGSQVFYNCSSLSSVTIPSSVTSIQYNAFHNCYALTSVTIPSSVTKLSSSMFFDCYSLTSVTIPDSVTSIEDNAFGYCNSFHSIIIPSSVTSIYGGAFGCCYALTSCTVRAQRVLSNLPGTLTSLTVRKGYGDAYKEAYPMYANIITESSD